MTINNNKKGKQGGITLFEKNNYYDELIKRRNQLNDIIERAENSLTNAPEGTLRIAHAKKSDRYQFFLCSGNDKWGKYISTKDISLVKKLMQKKYDTKILKLAKKELKQINILIDNTKSYRLEAVYEQIPTKIRKHVSPYEISDTTYAEMWLNQKYEPKAFHENDNSDFYTKKNERVRSKSEVIIANSLYDAGIPYIYELPIKLRNGVTVHPDFTILKIKTRETLYWEHLGMMDDREYVRDNMTKLSEYRQANIISGSNMILTFESSRNPLSIKDIQQVIKSILK